MSRELRPLELDYRHEHPLRTLWQLYAGDRGKLLAWLVLYLMRMGQGMVTPVALAAIINEITAEATKGTGDVANLLIAAGVIVAMLVINFPSHFFSTHYLSKATRHVEVLMRRALVQRLQEMSMAAHDELHSGKVHSKVLRDVEIVHMFTTHLCNTVISGMWIALIAFGVALVKEPRIALLFVLMAPVSAGLVRLFKGRMKRTNREFRGEMEQMSSTFSEMVDMIPVTRAHGAERTEMRRVSDKLQRVKEKGYRLDILQALFIASSWTTAELSRYSCLAYAGYLAWHGQMPIGDVVMYQMLFMRLLGGLQQLIGVLPMLSRGYEAIRSLGDILECPDLEWNRGKQPVEEVRGRFDFQSVRYTYPRAEQPALQDFNLTVEPGETIALVGESGAGKSTVMGLVIGFRRPTAGRILLDGRDMEQIDLRTYRRHLAVVPQETVLFSGSVRDNITYGMEGVDDDRVAWAVHVANLEDVVEELPGGLDTTIGEHGSRLSGGQRQRLAIARAVIRDPKVILLDEATSSLDVLSEQKVQEAIERLAQGRTTFIVAHRLSTVRKADRIVVMRDGRIVESGSERELLRRDSEYARLRALQV